MAHVLSACHAFYMADKSNVFSDACMIVCPWAADIKLNSPLLNMKAR